MPYKDKAAHAEYRKKRYEESLQFVRDYKVSHGCADCGYNENHAGLELDHVEEKTKSISRMYHHSRKSLMDELSKCEVVCGTCHNIRSFTRGQFSPKNR